MRNFLKIIAAIGVLSTTGLVNSSFAKPDDKNPIVALFECNTGKVVVDGRPENRALNAEELKLAAAGFCSLRQNPNGSHYCDKGSCVGSCKLYNWPVRCSCE
jgi:hypothetical protein